jgi:predicted nucleic acid-binding protein
MNDRFFLDTNMLVYAHDRSEHKKQRRAIEVLDLLALEGNGYVSVQNLSEFFWVATRKLPAPLSLKDAQNQVIRLTRVFNAVDMNSLVLMEALRGVREHKLALRDAQVWASAKLNQVPVVLSEDFQHRRTVEGVLFLNPFVKDSALGAPKG